MLRRTPQYDDDRILSNVRYRGSSPAPRLHSLEAAHAGEQAQEREAMDTTQRRLDTSERQFDERTRFSDEQLGLARSQGRTANALALGGLALGGVGAYQEGARADQYQSAMDDLISKFQDQGDESGMFYANFLNILRSR